MSKDEEYVRSVWQDVDDYKGRGEYVAVRHDSELSSNWHSWSAAANFTRDRLEQVRQLRAEIAFSGGLRAYNPPTCKRLVARLESALAKLTAGMKPEALQ